MYDFFLCQFEYGATGMSIFVISDFIINLRVEEIEVLYSNDNMYVVYN